MLTLRLASAIAPAWPDLRAPLICSVGVVAMETWLSQCCWWESSVCIAHIHTHTLPYTHSPGPKNRGLAWAASLSEYWSLSNYASEEKWRRVEYVSAGQMWEAGLSFWKRVSVMLMYHFSLISLIPPQSSGPLLMCKFVRWSVFWKDVVHPQWSQVFLQEVTLLQPLIKLDH